MSATYILCNARSGSHLLCSALAQHPQIEMHYEVFCDYVSGYTPTLQKMITGYCNAELPLTGRVDKKPWHNAEFLKHIDIHGGIVKILYNHLTPEIEQHLRKSKVIHLVRNNPLAILVSMEVARRQNIWHLQTDAERARLSLNPVFIDPIKAEKFAAYHQRMKAEWADCFTVEYENLIVNWQTETRRIQTFLNLESIDLLQPLAKSVDRPLEQMIVNIDQFRDTELAIHLNN